VGPLWSRAQGEGGCRLHLADLSPAQREAVTHGSGPLLILAGAGSGKTRTLTHRLAFLLEQGLAAPQEILAITFTNKAAQEMAHRTQALVGPLPHLWVHTFHAACLRILRQEAHLLGYPHGFAVYDTQDQLRLMRQVLRALNVGEHQLSPAAALSRISLAKGELVDPASFLRQAQGAYREELVAKAYIAYQAELAEAGAMDFDDLLFQTVRLFQEHPEVLLRYQDRFRFLLVDEYQDTNTAQYRFIRLLAERYQNLSAVGDPDQAIYGWRGADFRNILRFREDFPTAKVVVLEENYRSTGNILSVANAVVRHNRFREEKKLVPVRDGGAPIAYGEWWDDRHEAQAVVAEVGRLLEAGLRPSQVVVLYRVNAQSRPLEESLLAAGLPYRLVGAVRFYDRQEVKDALSFLRLAQDPRDWVSLERAAQVVRWGLGATSLERLREESRRRHVPVGELLTQPEALSGLSPKARQGAQRLGRLVEGLRERARKGEGVHSLLDAAMEASGLRASLQQEAAHDPQAQSRLENLQSLLARAREAEEQGRGSLEDFLGQVSLTQGLEEEDRTGRDGVLLMTLHMAKGLEFPAVFVVGLEEGLLPHRRAEERPEWLEEERRLFYVGITRAQDRLYLSWARRRALYGARGEALPTLRSRFWEEVPRHLLVPMEPPIPTDRLLTRGEETALARGSRTPYRPGDRVVHPRFGVGTVLAVTPQVDDLEVSVHFDEHGLRHLLASLARLRRAEGS
jgi:DNA helicase-2/ATP-dependent DNA helicase PcrA